MKRGFTLVELLVTMGLMAMLATISTVGYFAAVRGMADRGAREDVISFLRQAQQRALIDDMPVAVYLYNKTIKGETADGLEAATVVGEAVAVRMAGRITYVNGSFVCDEFADWKTNYGVSDSLTTSKKQTMFLYRLARGVNLSQSRSSVTSTVRAQAADLTMEMLFSGLFANQEANVAVPITLVNAKFKQPSFYGFEVQDGFSGWVIGDAYGFEFATLQLPKGYLFDSSYETQLDTKEVGSQPVMFIPQSAQTSTGSGGSESSIPMVGMTSVQVYTFRPGKTSPEKVGSAIQSSDLED